MWIARGLEPHLLSAMTATDSPSCLLESFTGAASTIGCEAQYPPPAQRERFALQCPLLHRRFCFLRSILIQKQEAVSQSAPLPAESCLAFAALTLKSFAPQAYPHTHTVACKCASEGRLDVGKVSRTRLSLLTILPALLAAARNFAASSSINPHSPSTLCGIVAVSRLFNEMSLSDIALSCPLDFMSCSVALDVMPHSATSRATGDDNITIVE
jgi:hypothetical protein